MSLPHAPNQPRRRDPLVDRAGVLTETGYQVLVQLWRQVAAGYMIVPCSAAGTNAIVLTPLMHKEGNVALNATAGGMGFFFPAAATSTGAVTIEIANSALKAYVTNGSAQASTGDIVQNRYYLTIHAPALDSGAGGFVVW